MPPKKKKNAKGPQEKIYELITLAEMNTREQKYNNHLNNLKTIINFSEDALQQMAIKDQQQSLLDKWLDHISCNPLPKPYMPYAVRLFFAKQNHMENLSKEATIDWLLAIDDRSILTQNIFRIDRTRDAICEKLKPEFGLEYNTRLTEALDVLKRIEYFLANDEQVAKCSQSMLQDIKTLKIAIHDEIRNAFDRYTYRILCSEEAYMNSISPIVAEYCFAVENFQMHIWTIKNVAIRFAYLNEPRLMAHLHAINLHLHIPYSMLKENLTLRALHMNFDHISEAAKSYFHEEMPTEHFNAGIQDLYECLMNEWFMLLEIQARVRNNMLEKRLEYEEKARLFEEEEAKRSKDKGNKDNAKEKPTKSPKPPKEVPNMPEGMLPDVYQDFLEEETKQFEDFNETAYNPRLLNLSDDEINLKRCFILGGVYQLYFVEKPSHCDFTNAKFNMTWHESDSQLICLTDKRIPKYRRLPPRKSMRIRNIQSLDRLSLALPEEDELKDATDPKNHLFVLRLKLPDYLCYWGSPVACHFETITKVREEPMEEIYTEAKSKKKAGKKVKQQTSLDSSEMGSRSGKHQQQSEANTQPTEEPKKNIKQLIIKELEKDNPKNLRSSVLEIENTTTAPTVVEDVIAQSSLDVIRLSQPKVEMQEFEQEPIDMPVQVQNFEITDQLSKPQIRHLQRHAVPRLISSYKFPKELQEEMEEMLKRSKGKAGTLLRKQAALAAESSSKSGQPIFSYSLMQNNPERLFVNYPEAEELRVVASIENTKADTTQTFYELMRTLDNIKQQFKLQLRKTLDLPAYKSKVRLHNKLFVELKKKQSETTTEPKSQELKPLVRRSTRATTIKPLQSFESSQKSSQYVATPPEFEVKTETYSHWTTRHIKVMEFDKEKNEVIIQTDRLGYLGFAYKRYEQFPFKYWSLKPSEDDPDNEVVFTLETQYVRCVLYVTDCGIRGHVTEPSKTYVRNPKMYLVIEEPMRDYKEFKRMFKEKNLNIFAEHDACFYIENGYFSEKHLSTECHTYACMAVHSTNIKFNWSQWNRLAKRREILLQLVQHKDMPDNLVEVRIQPESATFVETTELCSDDVNMIKLNYALTWRNIGSYSDLHALIVSMYPAATEMRCRNGKLICCLRDLLNEIRPLSFS